jgi:hypothetical protein
VLNESYLFVGAAFIACGTNIAAIKIEQTTKLIIRSFLANKFILLFPSYDIIVIIIHLTLRRDKPAQSCIIFKSRDSDYFELWYN